MGHRKRRLVDRFLLIGGAVASGVIAIIAAAAGDSERIGVYEAVAVVDRSGAAQVTEAIEYDFGTSERRGIFRDVPGLPTGAPVRVASSSAPDQFVVEFGFDETRIRIGDPNTTITGRHRYVIDYPIDVGFENDRISWNAVGTTWPVSISNVEAHLVTDRELSELQCSTGEAGAWDGCELVRVEPGHLMVAIDKLDSRNGLTISATAGEPLTDPPTAPVPAVIDASDPGTGVLRPGALAAAGALLAAVAASALVRRSGREQVWAGGSADAAFGPQFGEQYPVRRVDHDRLNELASTEFAPPKNLNAWQGGILHSESVSRDHAVAWLLERSNAGEVEFSGVDEDLTMTLNQVDSPEAETLNSLFGGRSTVALGTYDKQFSSGWEQLEKKLDRWYGDSPYWDPAGERRRVRTISLGFLVMLIGVIGIVIFAVIANRAGTPWLIPGAVAALLAGAGFAMVIRSWELRVRTPEGSGLWILTESFRRFINKSDAQHVEAAAKQGVLLDYTAWAVALGEADRWSDAVKTANLEDAGSVAPQVMYLTAMAPGLGSVVSSTATAPSSSGGGGGGSVGGGGGGGGGGSW